MTTYWRLRRTATWRASAMIEWCRTRMGSRTIVSWFLTLILVLRGIETRWPELTRRFWEDEVHHNYAILVAKNFNDLRTNIISQTQPFLDYALRKYFWFDFLGVNEKAMRLPSFYYGLGFIVFSTVVAYFYLLRRQRTWPLAVMGGWCVGLWAVYSHVQIYYAAEARHYALCSLLSAIWAYFFLLDTRKGRFPLFLAGLFLTNCHFFALPMVIGAYAVLAAEGLWKSDWRSFLADLAGAGATGYLTIRWNILQWDLLRSAPPGALAGNTLRGVASSAAGIWKTFVLEIVLGRPELGLTGVLIATLAIIAFLIYSLGWLTKRRDAPGLRLCFLLLLVLPAFFVDIRIHSDYPVSARYLTPFSGLALVFVIRMMEFPLACGEGLLRKLTPRCKVAVASALVALLGFPWQIYLATAEARGLHRIPENFSSYYRIYEDLVAQKRPLLILQDHCYTDDVPMLYLQFLDQGFSEGYEILCTIGCSEPAPSVGPELAGFLRTYPTGLVVLDSRDRYCDGLGIPDHSPTFDRILSTRRCVWKLKGVRDFTDLKRAAAAVGYPIPRE